MKNRIKSFFGNLEDKLHRLVWSAALKESGVNLSVYRNRISCVDYLVIDDGSETFVIKSEHGKLALFRKTPEQ